MFRLDSLPLRFITLLACLSLTTFCGCGRMPVDFAVAWRFSREDNWLVDDRYVVYLTVYHTGDQSICGKYIVRAYGDVYGTGGEDDGTTDNYDESAEAVMEPGEASGSTFYYYVDDPELKENNLSIDEIKQATDMQFQIRFVPSSSEQRVHETSTSFTVSGGSGHFEK